MASDIQKNLNFDDQDEDLYPESMWGQGGAADTEQWANDDGTSKAETRSTTDTERETARMNDEDM
ncbi:MAG TPA: hypothetical protein VLA04_01785 [Verrucomicrobiae bacterium]|nr:hypothetical protein [Verrucomicrobiae bacterium]